MNKKMIITDLKTILQKAEKEFNTNCYYDREGYFDYAHRGNA